MLVFFDDEDLEYFYVTPLEEIKGKLEYPKTVIRQYKEAVQQLIATPKLSDLKKFRGLYLKQLKGDKKGRWSIRLNQQYRLEFRVISVDQIEITLIEISKHYE